MRRRISVAGACVGLLLILLPAASTGRADSPAARSRRRSSHKNPSAEITAVARVESSPLRTTHRNGRSFEEVSVVLLSITPPEPPSGEFSFDTRGPVKIVHDLTCGGTWIDLRPGDRLDLRGEYVHTPNGRDLVHFTHPAGGECGRAGGHPDGYLRRHREAAAAAPPEEMPAASLARFRPSVRPILAARCAPCHETGGKMYARLPFDDPATVAAHAKKMARRLKDDDRKVLEAWVADLSAASSAAERPRIQAGEPRPETQNSELRTEFEAEGRRLLKVHLREIELPQIVQTDSGAPVGELPSRRVGTVADALALIGEERIGRSRRLAAVIDHAPSEREAPLTLSPLGRSESRCRRSRARRYDGQPFHTPMIPPGRRPL